MFSPLDWGVDGQEGMAMRLETITNVGLLIASIVVTGAVVHRFVAGPQPVAELYENGEAITPPPSVAVASTDSTAFLFLSSKCQYCTESMPFYSQLSDGRRVGRYQLVVLGHEPSTDLRKYLDEYGVAVDHIESVKPGQYRFRGTPSLLVVDRKGKVRGHWNGALRGRESEVIELLHPPRKEGE